LVDVGPEMTFRNRLATTARVVLLVPFAEVHQLTNAGSPRMGSQEHVGKGRAAPSVSHDVHDGWWVLPCGLHTCKGPYSNLLGRRSGVFSLGIASSLVLACEKETLCPGIIDQRSDGGSIPDPSASLISAPNPARTASSFLS
jgi:hypothetical protein